MKKAVSFDDEPRIVEVDNLDGLTDDEKAARWFTKLEMAESQSLDMKELSAYLRGIPLQRNPDFDMRGLEKRTGEASMARKMRTLDVIQGVLEEQLDQVRRHRAIDHDKLARLSIQLSSSDVASARDVGRADAWSIPEVARMEAERERREREAREAEEALRRKKLGPMTEVEHAAAIQVPEEIVIKSGIRKFLDRARRGQFRVSRS